MSKPRLPKPSAEPAAPLATAALHPDLQRHLDHLRVERRLADRTVAMYREALVRLERFAATAGLALRDVRSMHVRRWAAQLHAQGLAPRSIAIALSAWRGLYRWWGRAGEVSVNPVDGIRAPKAGKPLPKALPVDQAVALAELRSAEADPGLEARDRCIVELLYGCGLRIGELVGLDAAASDRAAGWIDAADGMAHVLGKGRKRRSVPVGSAALAALSEWVARRDDWLRPAHADQRALFVSQRGTRLTASQIRARLARRALQAGVPSRVHPHMLRHSFASHILQSSGDLRAVQELLGHANITTTQVYTRLDFGHLSKVYDAAHPRAKRRG